jgi:tetratricopeptide (TPR) repeat protein
MSPETKTDNVSPETKANTVSPEELPKGEVPQTATPEVRAAESSEAETLIAESPADSDVSLASPPPENISVPSFGASEQPDGQPGPKRFSVTQWVLGLVVVALLAYPLVRRATESASAGGDTAAGPAGPALSPSDQALLNQSFAYYQAGKYDDAITAANALLKNNPKASDGWNNLAAAYGALGRWDDAIKSARQALQLAPNNQLAKGNLAYAQKAKDSGAAPSQAPGSLAYFLNLSLADYQAAKFPECIDAAGKAIKLSPNSSQALNNRGACYGSLGMFDEEVRDEQEAVRLDPANQLAKNNLNWALTQKKNRDAVREKK